MGFRSYIREFLGAVLLLFRPLLPWCFPIREVPFAAAAAGGNRRKQEETGGKSAKIILFSRFQKLGKSS